MRVSDLDFAVVRALLDYMVANPSRLTREGFSQLTLCVDAAAAQAREADGGAIDEAWLESIGFARWGETAIMGVPRYRKEIGGEFAVHWFADGDATTVDVIENESVQLPCKFTTRAQLLKLLDAIGVQP